MHYVPCEHIQAVQRVVEAKGTVQDNVEETIHE